MKIMNFIFLKNILKAFFKSSNLFPFLRVFLLSWDLKRFSYSNSVTNTHKLFPNKKSN